MNVSRRKFLDHGRGTAVMVLAASAGLLKFAPADAAWNQAAFATKTFTDTVKALGGKTASESKDVQFDAPDIAENGAVVPVTIVSRIPRTESIAVLVDKNPFTLVAEFTIPAGTDAAITTRIKMGQTSEVHALVKAGGQYYFATKEIKVTLGGCGG